jgi:hypothetical protein
VNSYFTGLSRRSRTIRDSNSLLPSSARPGGSRHFYFLPSAIRCSCVRGGDGGGALKLRDSRDSECSWWPSGGSRQLDLVGRGGVGLSWRIFSDSKDSDTAEIGARIVAQSSKSDRFGIRNVTQKPRSVTKKPRSVTKKLSSVTENSRLELPPDALGDNLEFCVTFLSFFVTEVGK